MLQDFKCKSCGGRIEFSIEYQCLRCVYCGKRYNAIDLEEMPEEDTEQEYEQNKDAVQESYICESCGSEIFINNFLDNSVCPFCGNVFSQTSIDEYNSSLKLYLPFRIPKEGAVEELKKYLSQSPFLPKIFYKINLFNELKTVYVPVWLFDANAIVNYDAIGIRRRNRVINMHEEFETYYYAVHRLLEPSFRLVPICGTKEIDAQLVKALEPFEQNFMQEHELQKFEDLHTYEFDVASTECETLLNERIKNACKNLLDETVQQYIYFEEPHFDVHTTEKISRQAYFPVYVLNVQDKQQSYSLAINGQTGKVAGEMPFDSKERSNIIILLIFVILAMFLTALMILLAK